MTAVTIVVLGESAPALLRTISEMTVHDEATGTEAGRLAVSRDLVLRLVTAVVPEAVGVLVLDEDRAAEAGGAPHVVRRVDVADRESVKAALVDVLRAAVEVLEAA
jgi:hypothetical protein